MESCVKQVKIRSLSPLSSEDLDILPRWMHSAIRTPLTQPWAENWNQFAVDITDDLGNTGSFGPISASVATIVRDQIGPAVLQMRVRSWRSAVAMRPQGRHQSGAHARLALSAVELALWDLRSRATNTTVGDLLGGRMRTVVPAYASALGIDIDHSLAPEIASWLTEQGFWGQKWSLPGHGHGEPPHADIQRLERLRAAIGDRTRLCVDAGGRWDSAYGRQMLPALVEHQVMWLEEPGATRYDDLARLGLAHATGEHDYDPGEQIQSITGGHVQVWQPEPAWNGGLAQSVHMVDLATALGIPCFPHGAGLPAAVQLASVMDSRAVPAVEYHITLEPLRQSAYATPLVPERGRFTLTDTPGLTSYRRHKPSLDWSGDAA